MTVGVPADVPLDDAVEFVTHLASGRCHRAGEVLEALMLLNGAMREGDSSFYLGKPVTWSVVVERAPFGAVLRRIADLIDPPAP